MANLSYEREEKFNRKFVESIEKVLVLIEVLIKESENNSTIPQNEISSIRVHLKNPDAKMIGSKKTEAQRAEEELNILFNKLPQDILSKVKQFYTEQVAELKNYLQELQNEESSEKTQEEEKYREELKSINRTYNLLYNHPRSFNSYTHEICVFAPNAAIESLDSELVGPYPYKSENIVDLMEEVETVRHYMKQGFLTPEEIEWQLYLDSLVQSETTSVKPKTKTKTKPEVICPINQIKRYTDNIKMNKTQQNAYSQILQKVCANCVKKNFGR